MSEELGAVPRVAPLVEEIPADDPSRCDVRTCKQRAAVLIGEGAELALCAEHAADVALQLLRVPAVKDALTKRETACLVLTGKDELILGLNVLRLRMALAKQEKEGAGHDGA